MLDANVISEYLNKQQYDELIIYLNEHKVGNEENAYYYFCYAAVYYHKKEYTRSIPYFEKAAEYQNPFSMGQLAYMYFFEVGTSRDYKKAFKYAKMGADLNNDNAIYILGRLYDLGFTGEDELFLIAKSERLDPAYEKSFEMYQRGEALNHEDCKLYVAKAYLYGLGVPIDYTGAFYRFMQLRFNYPYANYCLGVMYYKGLGVDVTYWLAKDCFETAAKDNIADAMKYLSYIYYYGLDISKDIDKAYEWAKKGADLGNAGCCYVIGRIHKDRKEYDKALEWFIKGEAHDYCRLEIGYAYYNGRGVSQDYSKAFQIYEELSYLTDAKSALAQCYYFGHGCMQSYPKAIHHYQQAANAGDFLAMGNLAHMYYDGEGTPVDYEKVYQYAKQAAKGNERLGYFYLAALYAEGKYLKKNEAESMAYLKKAAQIGDSQSQYLLAMGYKQGKGVTQDMNLYHRWIKEAANNGNKAAQNEIRNDIKMPFYVK